MPVSRGTEQGNQTSTVSGCVDAVSGRVVQNERGRLNADVTAQLKS